MVGAAGNRRGGFCVAEQNQLMHIDIVPWRDQDVAPI